MKGNRPCRERGNVRLGETVRASASCVSLPYGSPTNAASSQGLVNGSKQRRTNDSTNDADLYYDQQLQSL